MQRKAGAVLTDLSNKIIKNYNPNFFSTLQYDF